jgi:ketol-acid reductoisomerase
MAKIYTDKDADLGVFKGKTLAVLGFGSQGHAHALNLKESGAHVIIGLYPGSKSREVAKNLGFEVYDTAEAVKKADVIMVGLPDTKQPAAYKKDIEPNLAKGKTLLFSHGFSIHYKTIVPPKDVNVIMVAPKGPGHIVRRQFTEGKGVPALIAVYQNPGKDAKKIALAWAKGVGGTRAGVLETDFKEETETDLVNKLISQETIKRQEEILTRLLESEKAEKEREMDEKRQSNEAKNENYSNPEKFFEYNSIKLKEVELLKTVPPSLKTFYRNKVNEYFYNFVE